MLDAIEGVGSAMTHSNLFVKLQVLNSPHQTGKFNWKTQFPYYKEVLYKSNLEGNLLGKPVIFDMDMSPGDFITLFYLLKMPVELIDLKVECIT